MLNCFLGKFSFFLIKYVLKNISLNILIIGKISDIRNYIFKSLIEPKYNNIIQDKYNFLNSISYKKMILEILFQSYEI